MAKKDDILTEMLTMRLREDAAAAYRGKTPAERREIMQQLRERLDELLFPYSGISKSAPTVQPTTTARTIPRTASPNSAEPTTTTPGTRRRRPPIPND